MTKNGRWTAWVLVVVLLVTPLAAFAQGGDEVELVEYVTEDELLTVAMPADWVTGEIEDYPFPHVASANSQEAYDRLMAEEETEEQPGDKVILVTILPLELLGFMGAVVPDDADVEDLAEILAASFLGVSLDDDDSGISEAEDIELNDDLKVGLVRASDEEGEGIFIVRDLGDGVVAMLFIMAMVGEYTEDLTEMGLQIVETIEFSGTADAMMMAIFGEMDFGTEEPVGGALDGAALVAERCSVCHTTDRIDAADKDQAGWTATVDRMIGKGAQLSAEEREAVIAYLVETH